MALSLAAPARADKAACGECIAMIKVGIAKAVPETTSVKLKTVLHVAEREMGKGESDESVVALADAKRAQK